MSNYQKVFGLNSLIKINYTIFVGLVINLGQTNKINEECLEVFLGE